MIFDQTYLIIAIAILASVTLNRGIYLYHKNRYQEVEQLQKDNGYNVLGLFGDGYYTRSKDKNDETRDKIRKIEKELRIEHFRVGLAVSVVAMILGHMCPNPIISNGLMLGSLFNIIYTSLFSWIFLEEAEKFTVSAAGLAALIFHVAYIYK